MQTQTAAKQRPLKTYYVQGWIDVGETLYPPKGRAHAIPLRGPMSDNPVRISAPDEEAARAQYARSLNIKPRDWDTRVPGTTFLVLIRVGRTAEDCR